MPEVVKRIEKFAPKREREEEDDESQDDSNNKRNNVNNNNKGKGTKTSAQSRMPFKFFEKPKELPKSDREQQSEQERGGKSGQSKMGKTVSTLNSAKPFGIGKPFKKGSKESLKNGKKGTKEPFSKFARGNQKDMALSKESKKKKAAAGTSLKLHRCKTI
uniref:Uncharacterized protein n=1 Tax=Panagrolaimus davidi TaxID=227884 RepID=A0A914QTW4_9BILA